MKVVFLTGASSGLGLVIARKLLENGYFVVLHYFKNKDNVAMLSNEYQKTSFLISGDISNEENVLLMKKELDQQNIKVDILINNAAIEHLSELNEKNEITFLNVFKVNTLGSFYMMKHFGYDINENHGSIINISSDNTIDKYDIVTLEYDVSKSGLNLMTKTFANYFLDTKINAVAFGWLDTPMNDFPEDIKSSINFVSLDEAAIKVIDLITTKETGKIEMVR